MSWNGTVRCGHCGIKGHNRRACPTLQKTIRQHPDGYEARIAKQKKAYARTRVCGYCQTSGHNKRTCPEITRDRIKAKKANRLWRESFFNVADKVGFGKGALLEMIDPEKLDRDWERGEIERYCERFGKLALVIGFNSDQLNYKRGEDSTYSNGYENRCVEVLFPNGKKLLIAIPGEFAGICDISALATQNKHWSIAGGVGTNIRKNFTASFKDGSYGVDEILGLT